MEQTPENITYLVLPGSNQTPNVLGNDDLITCNQLMTQYGTESDLNDLSTLLHSWNLSELYPFFLSKFSRNRNFYRIETFVEHFILYI